ncbi:uncharacterized protein LOC128198427 [Bicyclus anynana]|uniref:Uncharacterized protein LOC128198427 n=1 Tax=Bicyclus anynana TaxID=110368 RepID=A0ABM3LLC3_BICAN|nr:uncharacterized protein LOC128198427 [Bicyclus anynana]
MAYVMKSCIGISRPVMRRAPAAGNRWRQDAARRQPDRPTDAPRRRARPHVPRSRRPRQLNVYLSEQLTGRRRSQRCRVERECGRCPKRREEKKMRRLLYVY